MVVNNIILGEGIIKLEYEFSGPARDRTLD